MTTSKTTDRVCEITEMFTVSWYYEDLPWDDIGEWYRLGHMGGGDHNYNKYPKYKMVSVRIEPVYWLEVEDE